MTSSAHRSAPGIAVVAIWAPDVSRTAHFYRDVIGLRLLPQHGAQPHFDLGGTYLTILEGTPHAAEGSRPERFPLLAFRVSDLTRAVERLQAAGVDLPGGIEGDAAPHWIMFHDPGGNLIELVENG